MEKYQKYNWKDGDSQYRKFGDDAVFRGPVFYNYDNDCWRYAPDLYQAYWVDGGEMTNITKKEAKEIVERNGGTKFDDVENVLFVSENGEYVGFD